MYRCPSNYFISNVTVIDMYLYWPLIVPSPLLVDQRKNTAHKQQSPLQCSDTCGFCIRPSPSPNCVMKPKSNTSRRDQTPSLIG